MRRSIEERTGLPSALEAWLREPPRLPPLLAAVFVLFAVQAGTGLALSLHYSPSATDAWGSVYHLQRLPLGSFLRSLHHWGASALVATLGLHLLLTALSGRYRAPREASWWLGLALLLVTFGFAMTGNALPWDQRGYWGALVEAEVMASVPLLGSALRRLFLGGDVPGHLTLTRLASLHGQLLPLLLLPLLGLQLRVASRTEPARRFVPTALVATLVVAAIVLLAIGLPVVLEAPAEPTSRYEPSPAWYFLPLNRLLALFPGNAAFVATTVIPLAVGALLFALPLVDRQGPGLPRIAGAGAFFAAFALASFGPGADRGAASEQARFEAERAHLLAAEGLPPDGASAMMRRDPLVLGGRLFGEHCASCHPVAGKGADEQHGPDLGGYLSEAWLRALIEEPRDDRFFGTTDIDEMDPYAEEDEAELASVARFVAGLRHGDSADEEGREAFESLGCDSCHELEAGVEGGAPNLAGYGSDDWLLAFLREPDSPLFYGESNEMPAFGELAEEELRALVAWLRRLEALPLAP